MQPLSRSGDMESSGFTLVDRLKKTVRLRRTRTMRRLAAILSEWSARCLRFADPPSPRPKQRGTSAKTHRLAAKTTFEQLLREVTAPAVAERLLSQGLIGDDLPRTVGPPSGRRILVLAPHQDDEIIGAGGTFILCARGGATFEVIYYTDGATPAGGMKPQDVSRWRADEARQVWRRLAGVTPTFWNYPNRADAMAADAPRRLARAIEHFRPDTIFVPVLLEQPVEHRRMTELLLAADRLHRLDSDIEIWGYQITTRLPGNAAVDITSVWRRKYALNRRWATQNAYMDYAHLAMGRDIANTYYLKGRKHPRRAAAHAEVFLAFPAPEYLDLARSVIPPPDSRAGRPKPPPPDFLIVGMQKSGSYWLTALLDAHPDIRCFPSRPGHADGTGEAHLFDLLALIDRDFPRFRKSMATKLGGLFAPVVPDAPPATEAERQRIGKKLRRRFDEFCQLQRERSGKRLVGEKTTETVHHPELVDELYPGIRKVCIVRDPRDRVVSFLFHQQRKYGLYAEGLSQAEVDDYIDRVRRDYIGLLRMSEPVHVLTYEGLSASPDREAAALFEFLGAEATPPIVESAVHAGAFENLSGRPRGMADVKSHFRKGVPGDRRFGLELDFYRTSDSRSSGDQVPGRAY
jgi:LmbE family N-acetylglucosaminyl deacetylase